MPKERWPQDEAAIKRTKTGWHRHWGDRRQQLVFIGVPEADRQALTAELDACLIPLPKTGTVDTKAWRELPDPFPMWRREVA